MGAQSTAASVEEARSLLALGRNALAKGNAAEARAHLQRVVELDGRDAQQWVSLAIACQRVGDEPGEENAIDRALALDPMELVALILRANLLERRGLRHKAATTYSAVVAASPPLERLHPDLRPAVAHAWDFRKLYNRELASFIDHHLAAELGRSSGAEMARFSESVDIMVGRARRYDSQSEMYHYPRLPSIPFFAREEFTWLDAVEAQTDAIRAEFLEVLRREQGFTPYITYPEGVPLNQWVELNNSPRWSAFHLFKEGVPVDANVAHCPRTLEVLAAVPQPDMPGRTPAAMFSLLKPHTRIPPHTGVTNARLVVHLPLIVPEGCGFRVANETRAWVPGKAWVFDDTIEHEAWNDSDKLRVVLIFDIWHPHLSAGERTMITTMTQGLAQFVGGGGAFEL